MNRTRLFYQDQYGTGDGSGPDTAVSSGPGSAGTTSTVLHFPDRPGITGTAGGPERKTRCAHWTQIFFREECNITDTVRLRFFPEGPSISFVKIVKQKIDFFPQ